VTKKIAHHNDFNRIGEVSKTTLH